jgi:hypothetical protein
LASYLRLHFKAEGDRFSETVACDAPVEDVVSRAAEHGPLSFVVVTECGPSSKVAANLVKVRGGHLRREDRHIPSVGRGSQEKAQ